MPNRRDPALACLQASNRRFPIMNRVKKSALYAASIVGSIARSTGLSPINSKINGIKYSLDLEQFIDARLFYTRVYETDTINAIKRLLKDGESAVDVGANIGIICLNMAKIIGTTGHVTAFEPS
jgi:hypothetical protein